MARAHKTKPETRYNEIHIRAEDIEAESREVAIAFSSETPVPRWGVNEILDHGPKSVRLGRMNSGAAVLVNHNSSDHIGVVVEKSVKLAGGVGRCVVRFGKSPRAEEIFQDIVDGIRSKISVGYRIHNAVEEIEAGKTTNYRIIDWEPFEVSIVSVPADDTVGVGRDAAGEVETQNEEDHTMTPEERAAAEQAAKDKREREAAASAARMEETNAPAAPAVTIVAGGGGGGAASAVSAVTDQARDAIITAERSRVSDIMALGETFAAHGGVELAREFVQKSASFSEFESAMLGRMKLEKPPSAEIGLTPREIAGFSFVRVLHALANPKSQSAREAAAFEFECSRAAEQVRGESSNGAIVPEDVLNTPFLPADHPRLRSIGRRDLQASVAATGGDTIATDILGSSFIDVLRNKMVLSQAGMTVLSGLVGDVAIPRQTGGATAFWVGENVAPGESTQGFDQVPMTPHTVGTFSDISKQLLKQSSIDVEALVRADLLRTIAIETDRVGLNGSGAGAEPAGLANLVGIGSVTIADAGNVPTYAELVQLETLVSSANADIGALSYMVNSAGRGTLKTTLKAAGIAGYLWEPGNTVNGYSAHVSQQIATDNYWFGNWNDVVMGMWGGVELTVDPLTQSLQRLVRVMVFQDVDYAFRHPQSFALAN